MQKKYGLSNYSLKMIAIVFMLIDHINTYLGQSLYLPLWIAWLGRFVAPLFVYLLIEGFFYTRNRWRYLRRLLLATGVMAIGNIVYNLISKSYINPYDQQINYFNFLGPQNIFLTLTLIFALLMLFENFKEAKLIGKLLGLLSILVTAFLLLFSEGGIYLLPITLIMYAARKTKLPQINYIGITLFTLALLFLAVQSHTGDQSLYAYLTFDNEFMMITVLPFIYLYNHQRGGTGRPFEKYFFYFFYPIHLWILYALHLILN